MFHRTAWAVGVPGLLFRVSLASSGTPVCFPAIAVPTNLCFHEHVYIKHRRRITVPGVQTLVSSLLVHTLNSVFLGQMFCASSHDRRKKMSGSSGSSAADCDRSSNFSENGANHAIRLVHTHLLASQ